MNTHAQKKYKCKKFSSQTSVGGEIYSSWRNHEERAIEIARHYLTNRPQFRPQKWRHEMFKIEVESGAAGEWFHCKVLNILWRHFYGLYECRPWKIVVDWFLQ